MDKIRYSFKNVCANKSNRLRKEKKEADLCKSKGFNHTNDEIHIPRTPREEEREILDERDRLK